MPIQCDTKKEKTILYPGFGEKLFSLVTDNLPRGIAKDKKSVVTFFHDEEDLCFDQSCTYAWLKGDVSGTKSLTSENFKRILLFYIGKNGLNTFDEINNWVALGPRRYEDVLCSEEIQTKLRSKNMLTAVDPNEEMAERRRLWLRLVQRVFAFSADKISSNYLGNAAFADCNLIIIQGPPGFGKTTFLDRLWTDPGIRARYDMVFRASCDPKIPPEVFLDHCLRKLLSKEDLSPGHSTVLNADLQRSLRGKHIIFLVDNLSSPAEINVLRPLVQLGCLFVVATRSLDVARQAEYANVVELTAYSIKDVLEYYSTNYTKEYSLLTQEEMCQLADAVCYNPLGLNIALRRVAEEGCETVMKKIRLAPSILKNNVFEDLHKPLWIAYSSLGEEDKKRFRSLGTLPGLADYDEERLGWFWGVPRALANEILVRLEKEAGLVRRDSQQEGLWHIHPQVLNYARVQIKASPIRERCIFHLYSVRIALRAKRPAMLQQIGKKKMRFEIFRTYWGLVREEGRRKRTPILLTELRRLVDPSYSTDWSIFNQFASNCSLDEYGWGYRNYLESELDIWFFFIYLFMMGVIRGLQRLGFAFGVIRETSVLLGLLNVSLLSGAVIWMILIILRDLRRRYEWGLLWHRLVITKEIGTMHG